MPRLSKSPIPSAAERARRPADARRRSRLAAALFGALACAGGSARPAAVVNAPRDAAPPAPAAPHAVPSERSPRAAAESVPSLASEPASSPAQATFSAQIEACGAFACRWFDSGADAMAFVLAEAPLALGVGEAHALAGTEHLASTARRFSEELLPSLAGRASHLIVELLNPDPRCEATTREVRRAQEPVTAPQSKQNQSDYVELGTHARALGIEPFVLSPTCDEFRAIAGAGSAALDAMLTTIARVSSRMLRAALARNRERGRSALVIGYGGALHNDIAPPAERLAWSYGPDLARFTGGRYVELDLVVREFVKDTDAWRALPWYAHFDPTRREDGWLVMQTAEHRYALFFPKAAPAAERPH